MGIIKMMVLHLDQNQLQTIDQTRKVALKQHNEKTKKYRIIQTLLMISGIVLVCLGGFGVLGAGFLLVWRLVWEVFLLPACLQIYLSVHLVMEWGL